MTTPKKTENNIDNISHELARREAELLRREAEIARREAEFDLERIEAGKMVIESQSFDLRNCVESALDLITAQASEKRIDTAYLFEGDVPSAIFGDAARLRQVLLNLLSNALKFTEKGEVVLTVISKLHGKDAELTFAVRDTGIGLSAESINRLFQSFSQADSSTTRTGLGLVISKRLVELMGGKMQAHSEGPGKGSTFMFTIHAPITQLPAQSQTELDRTQPGLSGKRVLIIDDNDTNRKILSVQTGQWGMFPRDTGQPFEALQWVKNNDIFDVAILDMHMPEMDGIELARRIRRHGGKFPLILLGSPDRRELANDNQTFAAYLAKPIKQFQLFDTLVDVLADKTPEHVERRSLDRIILDPETAARHPLKILIVEDNPVTQKLAFRLLGQMGYRADIASNGLEALDALRRQHYDVIFMDVQMPKMNGLEAARAIRGEFSPERQPYIIAMTANVMQGDREACLDAGMNHYISKPIKVVELQDALEQIHDRNQ